MNDTRDGLGVLLEALTDSQNFELSWDPAKGELHLRRVLQPEVPQPTSGEIRQHLLRLAEEMNGDRKVLADLEPGDCRWPIGEPTAPDFHFCGRAKSARLSYCEQHARCAYETPRARKIPFEHSSAAGQVAALLP